MTHRSPPRRTARTSLVLLCAGLIAFAPSCATVTGLVTGAFTGSVDAPAEVYRAHRATMDRHPEYWIYNLLLFFPLGIAAGPLAGMAKGVSIDLQVLLGDLNYAQAFGAYYEPESVWRPYTIHW